MISSSIESNNLQVKQIESIQVDGVDRVPLCAFWLRRQRENVYSPLHCAYKDDISGSDATTRVTSVASNVEGLHQRMMSLLDNHHTSSLTYRPCWKHLNQRKKHLKAWFSIVYDKKTLQWCGHQSTSQLRVANQTCPHPEKHCIISWWNLLSPPCWPSATNHMNNLQIALTRCHPNSYRVVPNIFCIIETTEIVIVIDAVCEVWKSLETLSNVIL